MSRQVLALAFAVAFTVGVVRPAQGQLSGQIINRPCMTCQPRAVEVADFNGDEYPDVVVGDDVRGQIHLYEGTGFGSGTDRLESRVVIDSSTSVEDLATGDIDQDGVTDLVVATTTGVLVLYGNDGHDFRRENADDRADGDPISSGVYFLRMQAGSYTGTRKITVLR